MVDFDRKTKMVSSDLPNKSPKFSNNLKVSIPSMTPFRCITHVSPAPASDSACSAYEYNLRLADLKKLWSITEFPDWKNEAVLRPALQALEITFRFISTVLIDPRPYSNRRELSRRVESLAMSQIKLIGIMCEDEEEDKEAHGRIPIVDLKTSEGVLAREDSYAEVWKIPGETTVVNKTSEASLLPRLATWQKSEDVATNLLYAIECEMRRCSYTLGLGEPNLAGKPNLEYDVVCRPNELHALKKPPYDNIDNYENHTLYTTHQILESWVHVASLLTKRVVENIERQKFEQAGNDCYVVEKIWKLLEEIEDLHLLMDPDDFLRLKNQLQLKSTTETQPFCFRSRALVEITKACKELKHKVPEILRVEVDPKGGPRVQEAAMRLYGEKKEVEKIRLIQAMQGIEGSLKRFYFAYKQVLMMVMGSGSSDGSESLSQLFMEPTYFPSLDAAKTFLGEMWNHSRKQ